MEAPPTPSAQLMMDESIIIDFDGPPSSPFISEVDAQSRAASKQFQKAAIAAEELPSQEPTQTFGIGSLERQYTFPDVEEDKENMAQQDSIKEKLVLSPKKSPQPLSRHDIPCTTPTKQSEERRASQQSDSMPPPQSTRRTPKKTPLRASRNAASTPSTTARSKTSGQTAQTFQAGLDIRASNFTPAEGAADDTCVSDFSQVPDLTLFARLGQSPTKRGDMPPQQSAAPTPRTSKKRTSGSRSPSPTPRRARTSDPAPNNLNETQTFLIDFTQQLEGVGRPNASASPSKTEPNLLQYINSQRSPAKRSRESYATPAKQNNILNLLDFELPPAPTPRSVPTITVRELESLKSSYLSQISSLKATLSGREAEVDSLKKAVGDAERRAAEAQEALREEKCRREDAEQEKAGWERRGHELENVLKNVKEEVLKSEAEKEDLIRKIEDGEKRAEDAEERATKAEERFAEALAARADSCDGSATATEEQVQRLVAAQIDAKIEAVSRELHAVYKEKHERKVATLKKSYEARAEKKMVDLQTRISDLEGRNQELEAQREATFSGPVNQSILDTGEVELRAQIEEHKASLARLEHEMQASRDHQEQLEADLRQERIEKGDLVAAVDEMLALQLEQPTPAKSQQALGIVEDFRKSIRGPTALRAPAESKIGKGASGIAQPRSQIGGVTGIGGGKSRMLANIERMGRPTGAGSGLE